MPVIEALPLERDGGREVPAIRRYGTHCAGTGAWRRTSLFSLLNKIDPDESDYFIGATLANFALAAAGDFFVHISRQSGDPQLDSGGGQPTAAALAVGNVTRRQCSDRFHCFLFADNLTAGDSGVTELCRQRA